MRKLILSCYDILYIAVIILLMTYYAKITSCDNKSEALIKLSASLKPEKLCVGVPVVMDVTIQNVGSNEVTLPNVESDRHWNIHADVDSCPDINNENPAPVKRSTTLASVNKKEVASLVRLKPEQYYKAGNKEYIPLLPGKYTVSIGLRNDSVYVDGNPKGEIVPGIWKGKSYCYVSFEVMDDIDSVKKAQLNSEYDVIMTGEDLNRIRDVLSNYKKNDDYYLAEMLIRAYRNSTDNINKRILIANALLKYICSGIAYKFLPDSLDILENGSYPLDLRRGILQCMREFHYSKESIGFYVCDITFYELVGDIKRKYINTVENISRNGTDPDMIMCANDILKILLEKK